MIPLKFQLNYFDPIKKTWRTISTDLYKIKVVPNLKSSISPIGLSKEEIVLVGKDIRFIDESISKWKNRCNIPICAKLLSI